MKTYDIFGYSFSAIRLRKLRAALTTLGVIIGIAAIVALLSITQGLQSTITHSLNQGLSASTLIVTSGSSPLGNAANGVGTSGRDTGTGGPFGGGAAGLGGNNGGTGFNLYVSNTSDINALSPDITMSLAVIQKNGYIEAEGANSSVTIYGVDFNQYSEQYPTTFVAASGIVPLNATDNEIVVGTRS